MKAILLLLGAAVARGALLGSLCGALVGAFEAGSFSIGMWLVEPRTDYVPQTAAIAAAGTAIYAVIGAAWGALSALVVRALAFRARPARADELVFVAATLAAPIGMIAHCAWNGYPIQLRLEVTLWIAIAFAALRALALWRPALGALSGPWTTALVLTSTPWSMATALSALPPTTQGLWAVAIALAIVACAWIVHARLALAPRLSPIAVLSIAALAVLASAKLPQTVHVRDDPRAIQSFGVGQPNVVMISMDTVRADHLSIYGYERDTTPNLRALEATTYANASSTAALTLTAHASLFTGLWPRTHSAHADVGHPRGRPLADASATLAEILALDGFRTVAVVANHGYLGVGYGLDQGFDAYDCRMPIADFPRSPPWALRKRWLDVLRARLPYQRFDLTYRHGDEITAEALARIDQAIEKRERFFLFVNYMDAHTPYSPPPPYDGLFPGRIEGYPDHEVHEHADRINAGSAEIDPRARAHLLSQYDGGIAFIDAQIQVLVERLKAAGVFDECLLVITSDHGEAFGDRALMTHGVSVYQDQVHVPLIIKYPRQRSAERVDLNVSLVDVLPTVLEELGIPVPASVQGKSIRRRLAGAEGLVYAENVPSAHVASLAPRFAEPQRAVFDGRYKLVLSPGGAVELFDLATDPDELQSIHEREPKIAARLRRELARYLELLHPARPRGAEELEAGVFDAPSPLESLR